MHIAVTGITSGVGLRLAEMALERGHRVAGLVRDPARGDARRLGEQGVRLVHGDLDDLIVWMAFKETNALLAMKR